MPDITQVCQITGQPFIVSEWEQNFLAKMGFPLPTLCIDERHRRRLAHRNERSIYKRTCDLCKKEMITVYSPDKPYTIYCQTCWWSDGWNSNDYGRDIDFTRPFFDQFYELQLATPRIGLFNVNGQNSEYCNITNSNKNCYLVFGGDYNEDCYTCIFNFYSKDSADAYWADHCQLTFDCVDCKNCYNVKHSSYAENCRDSSFLYDCKNLEKCFGCVGLDNKKYHFFNSPCSPEEYESKIAAYRIETWTGLEHTKKSFEEYKLKFPHRHAHIRNSENCTGNTISGSKNCFNCFDIEGPAEDMRDTIFAGYGGKDFLSCNHGGFNAELFYEMVGSINGVDCAFSTFSWNSSNVRYCDMVTNGSNLFGCTNLNKSSHCILNKQYSESAYKQLVQKLIDHMKSTGEWGQFMPMSKSLYAYNETVAQDLFPLMKEETRSLGLNWYEEEIHSVDSGEPVPESIEETTDQIVGKRLICKETGKPYSITKQELALYKKLKTPVPQLAPETRHRKRIHNRTPYKLWLRMCSKCQSPVQTAYSPERPEVVYCERCYLERRY